MNAWQQDSTLNVPFLHWLKAIWLPFGTKSSSPGNPALEAGGQMFLPASKCVLLNLRGRARSYKGPLLLPWRLQDPYGRPPSKWPLSIFPTQRHSVFQAGSETDASPRSGHVLSVWAKLCFFRVTMTVIKHHEKGCLAFSSTSLFIFKGGQDRNTNRAGT